MFILASEVEQNVAVGVDFNHVLKFSVDDKVNHVGEVSLFYKLKIITRAVVWGQVKAEGGVARAITASTDLIPCILAQVSSTREKALIAC